MGLAYCNNCGQTIAIKVLDTRIARDQENALVKRTRQCTNCNARYQTYEILEKEYNKVNQVLTLLASIRNEVV